MMTGREFCDGKSRCFMSFSLFWYKARPLAKVLGACLLIKQTFYNEISKSLKTSKDLKLKNAVGKCNGKNPAVSFL